MHVLMISFDPALIRDGEARQRHMAYAERAGQLTVVTHSWFGAGQVQHPSPHLTIVPSNSLHKVTFPLDAYRLAVKQAQQHPVDLITTQDILLTGLVGVWLRRKLNVPLLVQNHSYIIGNQAWLAEHPLRNGLLMRLARFVLHHADMVRTVNRKERENTIQMGYTPERVIALPLATASSAFTTPVAESMLSQRRAELGLAPEHQVVLWVGYPVAFKRVPLLLKVFRRVLDQEPMARLVLLGDMARSPQDLWAAAQAEGIADQTIMRGPIRHDDLPGYYQLARVYAQTSSYEGVPRVLFEASAAGLPLVGMNVVGVDEVIQNGLNGCLVADGDVAGMANAILALLRDHERARTYGHAAQRLALEQYGADGYAEKWVSVWERALELGKRS